MVVANTSILDKCWENVVDNEVGVCLPLKKWKFPLWSVGEEMNQSSSPFPQHMWSYSISRDASFLVNLFS